MPLGIRVRYRVGVDERDRYGRLLAYVWLPDGRMLNRVMVQQGYAQPLTIPPTSSSRMCSGPRPVQHAPPGLGYGTHAAAGA